MKIKKIILNNRKELKEYIVYLKEEAAKFKLTEQDLSYLFDLFYMIDNPPEIEINFRKTLKLNKMDKWFYDFRAKIEDIVLWEFHKKNEK